MTDGDGVFDGPATGRQVEKLAGEVDGLRGDLRRKYTTAKKALRVAVAALALAFAAGVGGFLTLRHEVEAREADRAQAAVTACVNANQSRAAIEDRFEQLVTSLAGFNPATTAEVQAARDAAVARFLADFRASMPVALRARDCAPAAALNPAPLPPTTTTAGPVGG